jgi:hypothetical protein
MDVHATCQAVVTVSAGGLVPLANILLASATILSALVRLAELHRAHRANHHKGRG